MDSYIKNTEIALGHKNAFPMKFFTEQEERDLLNRNGCEIETFNYKKSLDIYGHDEVVEIQFSCRKGMHGDITQLRDRGNKEYGYSGSRHVNIYKKHSWCRTEFWNRSMAEKTHCYTSPKFRVEH